MSSQPVGQARRSKRPPVIPDDVADPAVVKATGLMTLPTRVRLRVDVETIVQDVNRFLRGWAGYFRYGNSARMFDKIRTYAVQRLALLVPKRHKQRRAYGFKVVAYLSPERWVWSVSTDGSSPPG